MRKSAILFLLLTLCSATALQADHYANTYVIPVVGHTMGANGTMWMSDVSIRNFSNTEMTVELIVVETGDDLSDNIQPLTTATVDGSVTVGANSTLLLRDILGGHHGHENVTGALLLGSDRPFAVTSRAYSSNNGLGQTVPAARDFIDNSIGTIDNSTVVYIPGIINNADARTNIGFVAGSAGSANAMVVEVSIRNAAGGVVGTRSFFIPAGNFAHYQFNIRSIANGNFDIGSADIRITQGEGALVPYASVVDNATGHAAYIMGEFPKSTPPMFRGPNVFQSLFGRNIR